MSWNSTSIPLPSYVRDKSKDKYVSLQSFWPSKLLIMFEKKNIYMIMCWTTTKYPSFPSNPVILCCLLIIEKAGTHFHRIYEANYIYSQEKEKKNNCPDHKKRANAYINFIHSYKTLHVYTLYTVKKKCDKMYFWRFLWDDVSVVLIWKNLKLWYDKPDYIIEKVIVCTKYLLQ